MFDRKSTIHLHGRFLQRQRQIKMGGKKGVGSDFFQFVKQLTKEVGGVKHVVGVRLVVFGLGGGSGRNACVIVFVQGGQYAPNSIFQIPNTGQQW